MELFRAKMKYDNVDHNPKDIDTKEKQRRLGTINAELAGLVASRHSTF